MTLNWEAPWSWSKRTRRAVVGRLVKVYVFPEMDGGYCATINGRPFRKNLKSVPYTFKTLPEAKKAVEAEVVKLVTQAYRRIAR